MREQQTSVLELLIRLDGQPFRFVTLRAGQGFVVGPSAQCDLLHAALDRPFELASYRDGTIRIAAPRADSLRCDHQLGDPAQTETQLAIEQSARVDLGRFSIEAKHARQATPVKRRGKLQLAAQRGLALSSALHLLALIIILSTPPSSMALSMRNSERIAAFSDYLSLAEQLRPPPQPKRNSTAGKGSRSRDKRRAGSVGKPDARGDGRVAIKGTADVKRLVGKIDVASVGVLGLLKHNAIAAAIFDPNESALGNDSALTNGNLIADQVGEGYGSHGLAVLGSGRGGGCDREDCSGIVGSGPLDTVGGPGGGPRGTRYGQGVGLIDTRRAGRCTAENGCLKILKPQMQSSCLDRQIVRRHVRRHANQVKYCYARELQARPELGGRIVVRFAIGSQGKVLAAQVVETTLENNAVESCVAAAVSRIQFPALPKQCGLITVRYPFVFRAPTAR